MVNELRRRDPACDVGEIVRDPVRVAEVRRTGLLDSPPEESFDRLTRLAARLVDAPAAFISLVDAGRDFYTSAHGFGEPLASTRQLTGLTFCHYAVAGDDPLIISDTRAHPVYSQVPTVESLGVAAYLGIPLVTSAGLAVGSFCVIDFEPRAWSDSHVDLLRELAGATLREIELRLALRDAEVARERAEAAIRTRDEIVAVLSHGLRDPIHTLRSSASMLLEAEMSDDARREFVQIIHRNASAMARLVADLVDVATIEAGRFRIEAAPVDSAALLAEAADLLAAAAADRGLELRVETAADLPPVLADVVRIQQVLANLVAQAIELTPAGGRVVVSAARRDDDVLFAVSDTGAGIPADRLSRVFDRFSDAPELSESGSGLRLAIVHGIVRAHGGAVGVASGPAGGSTFSFTIPSAVAGDL